MKMLKEIKERRSCRNFDKEKMPEEEKINEVINAGLYAANGMGQQNGIIIAITNKAVRDKLVALNVKLRGKENIDTFYGAPVILLVAVKKWRLAPYDGATMIENMLLEATNQGLGSCWIHRAEEEIKMPEVRELLSFTGLNFDEFIGIGHVIVGYSLMEQYPEKIIKGGRAIYK